MPGVLSTIASAAMAVGAPLVYADQALSIARKKDSGGFSTDVCAVLLIANITRCFFWLGSRFEIALLIQSLLMIIFQLGLLYLCLRYRRTPAPENENDALLYDADIEQERAEEPLPSQSPAQFRVVVDPPSPSGHDEPLESTRTLQRPKPLLAALRLPRPQLGAPDEAGSLHLGRPFNFWQWSDYSTYLEFLALYIVVLGVLCLLLGRWQPFVSTLGFFALGLESTLPIPQLISNWRRKSLAGFRASVLLGWIGGDSFKTIYFFLQSNNGLQFRICALFQLSIDFLIVGQAWMYRHNTKRDADAWAAEHEHEHQHEHEHEHDSERGSRAEHHHADAEDRQRHRDQDGREQRGHQAEEEGLLGRS